MRESKIICIAKPISNSLITEMLNLPQNDSLNIQSQHDLQFNFNKNKIKLSINRNSNYISNCIDILKFFKLSNPYLLIDKLSYINATQDNQELLRNNNHSQLYTKIWYEIQNQQIVESKHNNIEKRDLFNTAENQIDWLNNLHIIVLHHDKHNNMVAKQEYHSFEVLKYINDMCQMLKAYHNLNSETKLFINNLMKNLNHLKMNLFGWVVYELGDLIYKEQYAVSVNQIHRYHYYDCIPKEYNSENELLLSIYRKMIDLGFHKELFSRYYYRTPRKYKYRKYVYAKHGLISTLANLIQLRHDIETHTDFNINIENELSDLYSEMEIKQAFKKKNRVNKLISHYKLNYDDPSYIKKGNGWKAQSKRKRQWKR